MLFQALAKHVKRRQIVPKTVRMSRRVNGWQTKQYSICNVWKLSLHVYSKHNIVSLHDRKQLQDRQKISYIHIQLAYPRHMIHAYKYNDATQQENRITCHHYSWTSKEAICAESTKLHKPWQKSKNKTKPASPVSYHNNINSRWHTKELFFLLETFRDYNYYTYYQLCYFHKMWNCSPSK